MLIGFGTSLVVSHSASRGRTPQGTAVSLEMITTTSGSGPIRQYMCFHSSALLATSPLIKLCGPVAGFEFFFVVALAMHAAVPVPAEFRS
jgi:hypothetical protein